MAVAPVVVPRPIAADLARAVIGPDDPAVAARIIVIGRRVVEAPVKMVPVREAVSAVVKAAVTIASATVDMGCAKTATMEGRAAVTEATAAEITTMKGCTAATKAAAVKGCAATAEAAAVKGRAATAEAASTAAKTTTTMKAATTSAAAVTEAHFGRRRVGYLFRCRRRTGIDRRQRLGAFAGCGCQHQHRSSRKPEAADKAALRSWNPHHV